MTQPVEKKIILAKPAPNGAATSSVKWSWQDTSAILFAPRAAPKWTMRDLGLCPGRPGLLSGPSGGAKTIAAQSLALALTSGRPPWQCFTALAPIVVAHIDVDLGLDDTIFRYRRLRAGWPGGPLTEDDLGGRLRLCSYPDPGLDLMQPNARELLKRELAGVDLVILDALRGLASGNENDSQFGRALLTLAGFSSDTGCAALLLHHTGNTKFSPNGKPIKDDDGAGRGTSAIKSNAGVVLRIAGSEEKGRQLWMSKPPGRTGVRWGKKRYELQIDDVQVDDPSAPSDWPTDKGFGLRVSALERKEGTTDVDEAARAALHADHQVREALLAIARAAGSDGFKGGVDALVRTARDALKAQGQRQGLSNNDGRAVVKELVDAGKLLVAGQGSATRIYFAPLAPAMVRNLATEGEDESSD